MPNITPQKTRKKVMALAITGGLLSLTLIGGAYAALSANIATEDGTESLNSTLAYEYEWTVASQPIVADLTPVTSPVAQVFEKSVRNSSSVDSHFEVWVSDVTVENIPASLLNESRVKVTAFNGTKTTSDEMSLRAFLTTRTKFSVITPDFSLAPMPVPARTNLNITVEVTAPDNTSAADFSDALGFTSEGFITNVTFYQVINGTSALSN